MGCPDSKRNGGSACRKRQRCLGLCGDIMISMDDVIFTDGDKFFKKLEDRYIRHQKGLFIMSPSGTGKTYYCNNQEELNWIDGDELWIESRAQPDPSTEWWDKGLHVINRVEQRCDIVTAQAVDKGFWILGSVNFWLKPDALVIPDWEVLMGRIKQRQDSGEYDGGMKEEHKDQVKSHIEHGLMPWHTKHGVPIYKSIEEAVKQLTG